MKKNKQVFTFFFFSFVKLPLYSFVGARVFCLFPFLHSRRTKSNNNTIVLTDDRFIAAFSITRPVPEPNARTKRRHGKSVEPPLTAAIRGSVTSSPGPNGRNRTWCDYLPLRREQCPRNPLKRVRGTGSSVRRRHAVGDPRPITKRTTDDNQKSGVISRSARPTDWSRYAEHARVTDRPRSEARLTDLFIHFESIVYRHVSCTLPKPYANNNIYFRVLQQGFEEQTNIYACTGETTQRSNVLYTYIYIRTCT